MAWRLCYARSALTSCELKHEDKSSGSAASTRAHQTPSRSNKAKTIVRATRGKVLYSVQALRPPQNKLISD